MDLFYTAEWMARQDQDHSLPMQKKLKLQPVEEDGIVFKMMWTPNLVRNRDVFKNMGLRCFTF